MAEDLNLTFDIPQDEQTPEEIFEQNLPLYEEHITGKDIKDIAKEIGVSFVSMYKYFGGYVPDRSKCKCINEAAIKMLTAKGILPLKEESSIS